MKKRRQVVMVTPGKDVTLYIPTDTPPEVVAYLNRLKAEGVFSQGIMEILSEHILQKGASAANLPSDSEERGESWDDLRHDALEETVENAEFVPSDRSERNMAKPFSMEDIIRQATRNAGKLLHDRQHHE